MDFNKKFWDDYQKIITNFQKLPAVGIKSGQRYFEHLIINKDLNYDLIKSLEDIIKNFQRCLKCFCLVYKNKCLSCDNALSLKHHLFVIHSLNVFLNLMQSEFKTGLFFNFEKQLSLAKKITLDKLPLQPLITFINDNKTTIKEVILIFDFTLEGELTKNYLISHLKKHFPNLKITSLGQGISKGSAISYLDAYTFKKAFINRKDEE